MAMDLHVQVIAVMTSSLWLMALCVFALLAQCAHGLLRSTGAIIHYDTTSHNSIVSMACCINLYPMTTISQQC